MMKRCKKCDFGDCGDMCRFWRMWKREVPMKDCSEAFVKEIREKEAIKSNALEGTRIINRELLVEIIKKHFPNKV
jgi:hypothetical protein